MTFQDMYCGGIILTQMKKQLKEKKMNDKYIGVFPLEFAETTASEMALPDTIQLVPIGQWEQDLYGPIMITKSDCKEFIQNFNAKVRKGVYITAGHEGFEELPAQGWINSLEVRDTGLWGAVEWNKLGKETLSDKQFKFLSPEFYRDYEDPETHQIYRNVLIGAALTKSPYFKELEAVVFSDKNIRNKFNTNEMNLQDILAKKIEELSTEEKIFVVEHKDELTEEQKTAYATVINPETEEQKVAREAKEKEDKAAADKKAIEDANVAAGLNPDGTAKDVPAPVVETPAPAPVEEPKAPEVTPEPAPVVTPEEKIAGSDKVLISASELSILRKQAVELETAKLDTVVKTMVFSETNKAGKFLPKSTDNLRTFMGKLNAEQREAFSALLSELPKAEIFTEKGADIPGEVTTTSELDSKVAEKMKTNPKMKYSEALKEVVSENPGLEQRYDEGLPSAKKVIA